eukprot:jgi/Tetstr1/456632/TSEL_043335.t1
MASVSTFHAAAGTDDASWEDIMLPRRAREPPPVPRGPPLRYYLTTADPVSTSADDGGSKEDDVMGVGEDPVGEDGMDIDAHAWSPAGVEAADEGVIREGDPGDFYMKVIAKKFRGVWHYGVITGVVTECVLDDYGGATLWRAVFEDGDTVDLLRSEQINRMKAHRLYREPNPNKKMVLASARHADMSSAKAADLGVDAGELLVAGIHARSQDGA